MLKNSLFSPLCSAPFFCFSLFFFLSFSAAPLFLFLFPVSHAAVLLQPSFSFLFVCCPLFFSPKYFFFSPNVFQLKLFSAFQPKRFSAPKHFFQPKTFLLQSKTFFSSAQNVFFFLFQFSHSSLLLFSALFFSGSALFFFSLSAPPFFLFFSSVYPRPNILSSCFTSLLFE